MKHNNLLPILLAALLMTACGGSSSTTSGGGTTLASNNTASNNSAAIALADATSAYSGNRNSALLTTSNSLDFVNLVFGTENINSNLTSPGARPASTHPSGANLLQVQRVLAALAQQHMTQQRYQARAVDLRDQCPGGGSATAVGTVDDNTLTGTLQVTYSQCKSANVVTNGSALLVLHAVNVLAREVTAYTVSMKGLGVTIDAVPYTVTGTLRTDVDLTSKQETLTINQYQRNLSNGKQQLAENVQMVVQSSGHTRISGKFCDGGLGCVHATTLTPFVFAEADGVPLQGEMHLHGAANSKLQVIALGYDTATPPKRKLNINVDSDGDGAYEAQSIRSESILKNYSITPNTAPTAAATAHQAIPLGATLALDASAATDPEGDFLRYQWTIEAAPRGSVATLSNADSVQASFTPDKQGEYTFSVKVTDAFNNSALATVSTTVLGAVRPLAHNVVDAEYSTGLDKLVTVSSKPDNTLTILNPLTGRQQTVALELPPTSLALSADGLNAVVGHDGGLSQINLVTGALREFYDDIGFKVFDLAYGANHKIYLTPPPSLQWNYLYTLDLSNGKIQEDVSAENRRLFGGARLQYIPSLNALYTLDTAVDPQDLNRYDVSKTPAAWQYDSPYAGQYSFGGAHSQFWRSADGMYLLTAAGTLFQTANQKSADLRYLRALSDYKTANSKYLVHADHSSLAAKFLVVEADQGAYNLKTYTSPLLNLDSTLSLRGLSIDGSRNAVTAQFVFFDAEGTQRYALLTQSNQAYLLPF